MINPTDAPACKAGGNQKGCQELQESKRGRASDVSKVKMAVQLGNEAEEIMQKEEVTEKTRTRV